MRDHTSKALRLARQQRQEMSLPEVLLWRLLKQRPLGVTFRKQHPIGDYSADFYCAEKRVIIEIDSISHDMAGRPEHDARRDARLKEAGMKVVRIPAADVLKDVEAVADSIVRFCLVAHPPSAASRLPPPPEGEDF